MLYGEEQAVMDQNLRSSKAYTLGAPVHLLGVGGCWQLSFWNRSVEVWFLAKF